MLVLTRHRGESILIGNDIELRLTEIHISSVRLWISTMKTSSQDVVVHVDRSFHIADGVEVMVVAVRGERARLGIVAPSDVQVVRAEMQQNPPTE